jgi:hypothetical protein
VALEAERTLVGKIERLGSSRSAVGHEGVVSVPVKVLAFSVVARMEVRGVGVAWGHRHVPQAGQAERVPEVSAARRDG